MTASSICHICKKEAFNFHYTRPRKDAYDTHEGFWHCNEHGPKLEEVEEVKPAQEQKAKDPTHGMNRKERRLYARKGVIRA